MTKIALAFLALLLWAPAPTAAADAECNDIFFWLAPVFPPDPQGSWGVGVAHADGPWFLIYSPFFDPTAHPAGTFKGCDFWPAAPLTIIGPLVGDVLTTFVPPGPMAGTWQVWSATQSSNPVQLIGV